MTNVQIQDNSVISRVSRYIAETNFSQIPAKVVQKAKHHILDSLAVMVSGSKLKP